MKLINNSICLESPKISGETIRTAYHRIGSILQSNPKYLTKLILSKFKHSNFNGTSERHF